MHRLGLALLLVANVAHADPTEVGAFVGPHIFASDQRLGYIPDAPAHPSLGSSVMFGGTLAKPLFPWLVPELELAMSPASTNAVAGASSTNVFWLEPRAHMRFMIESKKRLQPYLLVGGGSPIALSSARKTFDSGIQWAGYVGGGVRYDTRRGFLFRADARLQLVPGDKFVTNDKSGSYIRLDVDVCLGVEIQLGRFGKGKKVDDNPDGPIADADKDDIPDNKDACPDRPEDHDGFDDLDGCPEIDNDNDRVLDIADKCSTVPETINGFQDDDGCPDTVPPEVDALRGTIEGLIYAEAETVVRDSAIVNIKKIAATMTTHPSIRVVLIGHTDDREAKRFAEEGKPVDLAELALDLSKARAEAVRQVLAANGIADGRVVIEGRGSEEPVAENDKAKGRLANRRVEIKLFVPKQ